MSGERGIPQPQCNEKGSRVGARDEGLVAGLWRQLFGEVGGVEKEIVVQAAGKMIRCT